MSDFVVPVAVHNGLVAAAYAGRGYSPAEALDAARLGESAARHGIRTHNAIKALHLDDAFGSKSLGCVPAAQVEVLPSRYKAVETWDAHRKLGQSVAYAAMGRAMELADEFGIGVVAVDNAFHYLWGGGYVLDAAMKGYVAYTNCTAALAEVVPFGGKFPTLGTNPHSWGFPTQERLGFPIVIDWATSTVAMGRVEQFKREGRQLPAGAGVDENGEETTDPHRIKSLLPFGQHKGYGLALIDELMSAYTGGSLPTLRNRWRSLPMGEKGTCTFYFQATRPEALVAGGFALGRSQAENVQAVLADIRGHGNDASLLPGELEARAARRSDRNGGLLFSGAEVEALSQIARSCNFPFDAGSLAAGVD